MIIDYYALFYNSTKKKLFYLHKVYVCVRPVYGATDVIAREK